MSHRFNGVFSSIIFRLLSRRYVRLMLMLVMLFTQLSIPLAAEDRKRPSLTGFDARFAKFVSPGTAADSATCLALSATAGDSVPWVSC